MALSIPVWPDGEGIVDAQQTARLRGWLIFERQHNDQTSTAAAECPEHRHLEPFPLVHEVARALTIPSAQQVVDDTKALLVRTTNMNERAALIEQVMYAIYDAVDAHPFPHTSFDERASIYEILRAAMQHHVVAGKAHRSRDS